MINSIDPNDLKAKPKEEPAAAVPSEVSADEDEAGINEDGTM